MAGESSKLGGTTLLVPEPGKAHVSKVGGATLLVPSSTGATKLGGTTLLVPVFAPATVANDDAASAQVNGPAVFIDVLANDTGQNLSVISVTQPSRGSVAIDPGGAGVTYTPPTTGAAEILTFTYTVQGDGGVDTATVTIDLTVPAVTIAADDGPFFARVLGSAISIDVLANDQGINLVVISVTQPSQGSASVNPGGTGVTYTPPSTGTAGTVFFTYTVQGLNGSDSAFVQIELSVPTTIAFDDGPYIALTGGSPISIPVLANDEGVNLTVTAVTQPPFGSASINPGGTGVTYTPPATATGINPGPLTFTYTVQGTFGSDIGMVTIQLGLGPIGSTPGNGPIFRTIFGRIGALRMVEVNLTVVYDIRLPPPPPAQLAATPEVRYEGGFTVLVFHAPIPGVTPPYALTNWEYTVPARGKLN